MANKQKPITLKTVHEMLDGMSVELAEKVHLLFMAQKYSEDSPEGLAFKKIVDKYCLAESE